MTHDSECQVSDTRVAGTEDSEVLEAGPDPRVCLAGTDGAPCAIPLTFPPSPASALAPLTRTLLWSKGTEGQQPLRDLPPTEQPPAAAWEHKRQANAPPALALEEPATLAKQQKEEVKAESEYDNNRELSRGEAVTIQDIYINPSVPELSQAPHASPQEGSSIPSSVGTAVAGEAAAEAAGEVAGDLQSVSPAPTGPADTKPAAPSLPGAAEQEQQCTPLAAVAQEEEVALAPASPGSPSYDAEQAAPQAPAPRRRTVVDRALQVSFLHKVLSRASVKHQGEASTAVASPAAQQEGRAASPAAVRDTEDEPGTATPPDTGALQKRRSSRFRRAMKSLQKTFSFSCMKPQEEEY
ncbi:uncharacterized protein ACIB01_003955 [Guaruba guarouba]